MILNYEPLAKIILLMLLLIDINLSWTQVWLQSRSSNFLRTPSVHIRPHKTPILDYEVASKTVLCCCTGLKELLQCIC